MAGEALLLQSSCFTCIYYKKAAGQSFTEYYLMQKVYSSSQEPQDMEFLLGLLR